MIKPSNGKVLVVAGSLLLMSAAIQAVLAKPTAPETALSRAPDWLIYIAFGVEALLGIALVVALVRLEALKRSSERLNKQGERLAAQGQQALGVTKRQELDIDGLNQQLRTLQQGLQQVQAQVESLRNSPTQTSYPPPTALPPQRPSSSFAPPAFVSRQDSAPIKPATRERVGFYNRTLALGNNTVIKEEIQKRWPSLIEMSLDIEVYRVREQVFLYANTNGIFYAVPEEGLYEIYLDPSFSVETEMVEAAFEIEGSGSYITSLVRPALFVSDGAGGRLKIHQKGKLVAT
ncbi:hypothetical protein [Gloeobacter kilaueensis]|uniref:Uncharacterized protein n=1 Tax=Gloeobacter kilaueensis (strain ATCC BAA-2537 / CCAP 1431/1 / ULC 316 / JS1) TaxID=1183438 RepID=U5QC78_GLOK1|nr:hypothetical protein [Gloeobacter kilaueensis]AGY56461.1 hypothetical protein GKIL_0214 [Gloeobacter kilaueensis JS1]